MVQEGGVKQPERKDSLPTVVVENAMGRLTKPLCSNLLPLIFLRMGDKIFVT